MIKVYTPLDKDFNYRECEEFFFENQEKMNDFQKFEDVLKKSFFFSFFDNKNFLGCIYYYLDGNDLYVNAFGKRHQHLKNLECFKMSLDWFIGDIYAYSKQKTAILCLLKCGFKKISENTYKYERK